jgi:hypothetical protein
MKKECDFSKGERGRFYKKGAKLNLPIYLDKKNRAFVERLAERKKRDVSDVAHAYFSSSEINPSTVRSAS